MSDQSSESSEEWILLDEDYTDLSSDDLDQSLNLELNYSAVCNAVSDSIGSSLSSEELEWQYEQYENYIIPDYSLSYIEDLNCKEFDVECIADSNASQIDGDVISYPASINNFAPVSKIRSYKHERNDNINFILNLILALAISSAFGLGIGHFLGWSHKCYMKVKEFNKATVVPDNLPDIVLIKQNGKLKDVGELKKIIKPLLFTENLADSVFCLNLKDTSISPHLTFNTQPNEDNNTEANLPGHFKSKDTSELKNLEVTDHFSGIGFLDVPNIPTDDSPKNEISIKSDFSDPTKVSSVDLNYNLFYKDEEKHIEFEFPNEFYNKGKDYFKEFYHFEEMSSDDISNLLGKNEINRDEFEIPNEMNFKDESFQEESNLTNQLANDFNQVIQSLNAIALARLNNFSNKYPVQIEDSMTVIKLYIDFQNLINTKITDINNIILSAEFRLHQKSSLKYLQKMVYSLIDSVDHLMKVTFKILNKRNKRLNVNKICNDISKVSFNFNKKWKKISRFWDKSIEKAKFQKLREISFKKKKINAKNGAQFEKGSSRKYNKLKRYSMRS